MRAIPLVVNLFGGPATGKSTLAALVYADLTREHGPLVAELTTEFAKDLVWEGRRVALRIFLSATAPLSVPGKSYH